MKNGHAEFLKSLQEAATAPRLYDEWLVKWKQLHDQLEMSSDPSSGFSEIEHAALGSLSSMKVDETHSHLNTKVCQMLDRFKHPALLVKANGVIVARNTMLHTSFGLNTGDCITKLPLKLNQAESLQAVIKKTLGSNLSTSEASFKKAHSSSSSHEYTLAITKSTGKENTAALVFIVSARFSENVASLVKDQYNLTAAECQVLIHFVKGYSLKEIASVRNRSQATVRTQFSTLMTKMGAHSQASLLRTAFSLSDFAAEIDEFSDVLEHPYRHISQIMRPGGRKVEVCFCGDPAGTPLLHIPNSVRHHYSSSIEEQLFHAGIYMVTVSPPAYGNSNPTLKGEDREKAWADDVRTVLMMLGIERCPVLATADSTYRAFRLGLLLPEHITRIVLLGANPPAKNWLKHGTSSAWIDGTLRIGDKYPTLKKLILSTGLKAWQATGAEKFMRLQLAKNKKDIAFLTTPENLIELDIALDSATRHGIKYLVEEISPNFQDYTDTIKQSDCDITVIHGAEDTSLPYQAMVDFKNEFPQRVQLIKIENAGFTVFLSHTVEICDYLQKLLAPDSNSKSEIKSSPGSVSVA